MPPARDLPAKEAALFKKALVRDPPTGQPEVTGFATHGRGGGGDGGRKEAFGALGSGCEMKRRLPTRASSCPCSQKCYEQKQYKQGLKACNTILAKPALKEHGGEDGSCDGRFAAACPLQCPPLLHTAYDGAAVHNAHSEPAASQRRLP